MLNCGPEIPVHEAKLLVELAAETAKNIDSAITIDGNVSSCTMTFFELKQYAKHVLSILSRCTMKLDSAIEKLSDTQRGSIE